MFGSDPELFAVEDGVIIPPIAVEEMGVERIGTLVPDDPDYHPVYYEDDFIKIIGDGAAFEFTLPAVNFPDELYHWWNYSKDALKNLLPDSLTIVPRAAVRFDLPYLLNRFTEISEDRFLWACRFGCDPQENAYTGGFSKEVDAKEIVHRYAGGHFHISSNLDLSGKLAVPFVKTLDQTVGILALFNSPYPEQEILRQEFYGIPGNFRRQKYSQDVTGIEYRTPSVSWLESQELIDKIFYMANRLLDLFGNNVGKARELFGKYNSLATKAILNYDRDLGEELLETLEDY